MSRTMHHGRIAWEDRFNRPTIGRLRGPLPAPCAGLFDEVRRHLLDLDDIDESFVWYGPCWRWAIEFRTAHSDDPLALLIPSPVDLQLAIPLDRKFASSLPVQRMKRQVRDGLDLAQEPFDTRWGVWSIQSPALLEDLQELIELKLQHLTKKAG